MSAVPQPARRLSDPVIAARLAVENLGPKHALAEVERLRAENPDDPDLPALVVLAALGTGDLERVHEEVERLLADSPGPGACAVAAEAAAFVNDRRRRDELLQRGQAMDSDHFLVLRATAGTALLEGDLPTARWALERSLELYPRDCETLRALVMVYRQQNDLEAEARVLDSPPDWFAGTAHYHRSRQFRALACRDLAAAEDEGRRAVAASCGRDAQAWAGLALVQLHLNKLDDCEQSARHALDLNSRQANALNILSQLAARRGDRAAAARYARQAAEAVPVLEGVRALIRGHDALRVGKIRAAISAFHQAERCGPSYVARGARLGLVQAHLATGRLQAAWKNLESALAADGLSDAIRCLRMLLLEQEGRNAEAEEDLRALTDGPRPFPAAIGHAIRMWHRRGRHDRVAALASYALANLPGTASDLAAIFAALDEVGLDAEARQIFEAAERLYPSDENLRIIALGLAARAGEDGHVRYELSRLPPQTRRRLFGPKMLLRPGFWSALVRSMFRRKSR